MEKSFKDLHAAALTMATHLLATLSDEQRHVLANADQVGSRLTLEIGPLPDVDHVDIFLSAADGSRVRLCGISIRRQALQ